MNTKTKNIFLMIFIALSYLYLHEQTHITIYELYGCEDIETNYLTYAKAMCPSEVILPTALNEIVGYSVVPPLFIFLFYLIRFKE